MSIAGIDMGAQSIKVVIVEDGKIQGRGIVPTGFEPLESAQKALDKAIEDAGISREDVKQIIATGAGRKSVSFAHRSITEVTADAKGVTTLHPSVRTIVDIGAEEARGISCDAQGRVLDFAKNDKCAAGAGAFVESMARALEIKVPELIQISLKSTQDAPINATCAVFAESEVVSLIHSKIEKADIAHAVHDAIASRVSSMVRRIPIENDVAFIGGVANNAAIVDVMNKHLGVELVIPDKPEFVSAFGAALSAAA
ncbi:MAG: acyl-CoA dehydratase activase [Dehalococcoidia bacterium]|nr:acyl-CoA dehydratase activase [Dehalococcoidia bacterium]